MTDMFGHPDEPPTAPSSGHVDRAVNDVLDLVQRGPGSREFTIPNSPQASRAILALFDAFGRNP